MERVHVNSEGFEKEKKKREKMEREIILTVLVMQKVSLFVCLLFNDKGFLWEILICNKEILLRF